MERNEGANEGANEARCVGKYPLFHFLSLSLSLSLTLCLIYLFVFVSIVRWQRVKRRLAEAMQTPEGAMAIASPDYRPWDKLQVLEEWYASRATKVKVSYFCDNFICI